VTRAALILTLAFAQPAAAAPPTATATDQTSEVVAGRVTTIDLDNRRLTLRGGDGRSHEFEASAETLLALKVGDRIEAKRRQEPR